MDLHRTVTSCSDGILSNLQHVLTVGASTVSIVGEWIVISGHDSACKILYILSEEGKASFRK